MLSNISLEQISSHVWRFVSDVPVGCSTILVILRRKGRGGGTSLPSLLSEPSALGEDEREGGRESPPPPSYLPFFSHCLVSVQTDQKAHLQSVTEENKEGREREKKMQRESKVS